MVLIGLLGATLLYGDGCITPAISVLSAIEGVKVYAPHLEHAIVPLTVVILAIVIQRNGTSWIGSIFGPVMLVWFAVAAALGIAGIVKSPAVLAALSPVPAVTYFARRTIGFRHYWWCFPCRNGWRSILCRIGHFARFQFALLGSA